MSKKIDITSTVLEKTIDFAKDFVDKLIMPSVEETGLLLKEKVTFWKFKNQVKMLNKAQEYCKKNNISPKTISLKVLCPLLDYAALEENEKLQDKWAILLGNMVDSEQNIENHVLPYILSQISFNEFKVLDEIFYDLTELNKQLEFDRKQVVLLKEEDSKQAFEKRSKVMHRIMIMKERKQNFVHKKLWKGLTKIELENLVRLSIIRCEIDYRVDSSELNDVLDEFKESLEPDSYSGYFSDMTVNTTERYTLSELGFLFIKACNEKSRIFAQNSTQKNNS